MSTTADLTLLSTRLGTLLGDVEAAALHSRARELSDADLYDALQQVAFLRRLTDRVQVALAGVVAERSGRSRGHDGFAQKLGHSSSASLLQSVNGSSWQDASRLVKVGSSLATAPDSSGSGVTPAGDGATPSGGDTAAPGDDAPTGDASPPSNSVSETLRTAYTSGWLTTEQYDAISYGLGLPLEADRDLSPAWVAGAQELIEDAQTEKLETLRRSAWALRDLLDPAGAAERYERRYEKRAFTMSVDRNGQHHGHLTLDDKSAGVLRNILQNAMAPRRGVRFVADVDRARAEKLKDDPRTNQQLEHDTLIELMTAGALADAPTVFGTKQAGVRYVQIIEHDSATGETTPLGPARDENDGTLHPAWVAEQQICQTGITRATLDQAGNPLDLGRESRLYTPKQRIALALRDGGCRWNGCTRPAHMCEAHHIDEWAGHQGRTDIDRGILLCAFHHQELHHKKSRITRNGNGDFILHRGLGTTRTPEAREARGAPPAACAPPSESTSPVPRTSPTPGTSPTPDAPSAPGAPSASSTPSAAHTPGVPYAAGAPMAPVTSVTPMTPEALRVNPTATTRWHTLMKHAITRAQHDHTHPYDTDTEVAEYEAAA